MSIQSEINRISQNVSDSLTAVAAKGVTVPTGSTSDDLPELISQITSGSGSAITITDELDSHGGTIRTISAVSLAGDTVRPDVLLSGYTAHNALGQPITGTATTGEPECPVFEVLNDSSGHEISITCNKTFAECVELFESTTNRSLSAIVRETGETTPGTPEVWDHAYTAGVYNTATNPRYLRYYSTTGRGVPTFQLTYYSDGTIVNTTDDIDTFVTLNATANGTYTALPDHVYGTVNVNVPSTAPNLQAKTNISPTTSSQTISADSGFDGLSSVQINAMPSGSVTAPSTISGTSATVSTGTNTLTLTKSVSVTPSVTTAGYISSGTAGNTSVSLQASVTTQAAQTIHPSTSNQTISSGRYLTGNQTINAVTTTNLTAENIKSGVVVQIGDSSDSDCVTSVTGTYSGGSSKNVQIYYGSASRTANSYGATNVTLTVAKTGTYKISWCAWRGSSSGTMGTNLHIGDTSGTNQQTWTGTYGQIITLENQSLTKDTVLTLYATSGSNSRTVYVGNLIIEEQ